MSIASAITAAQGKVADCYTAISNKGGTLPATQNLANMPTAISSIQSGSSGTIDPLTITPTTSQQTITASGGVDGYSPITVNAVTSSIDANISAGNIKSGVSILGVNGSVTELNGSTKTVTPTTSQQTVTPTSPSNGLTSVTVNAVTSSIDNNIQADNIKDGVSILGVTGTYSGGGGGGYSEVPSYKVTSGVANRRSIVLDGTEFSNITSVGEKGLAYAFFNCAGLSGTVDLSSITSIGNNGMGYAFSGCTGITSVDLSNLETIDNSSLYRTFGGCTGLTGSIDLSSLKTTSGASCLAYMFYGCKRITSADLSGLTEIKTTALGDCFNGCSGLTSVDVSSVEKCLGTAFNYAFNGCSNLQTIRFQAMNDLVSGSLCFQRCFNGCSKLSSIYFPSLKTTSFGSSYTNHFNNMFNSSSGSTATGGCTVHFPSNLSTVVSNLTGYPTFGGSSSYITIAFDLPATS